jgi:hypothetical protein
MQDFGSFRVQFRQLSLYLFFQSFDFEVPDEG